MTLGRRRSPWWLLPLAGLAATGGGCGAILGIADFSGEEGDGGPSARSEAGASDGSGVLDVAAGDSGDADGACDPGCAGTCSGGECVVVLAKGQTETLFVAANSKRVYWENATAVPVVLSTPLSGGTPATLTSFGDLFPFVVDESNLYCTLNGVGGGVVVKVPLDGGPQVTLASGLTNPWAIAVGANDVYWTECDDAGSVMAVSIDDGGMPTTLISGQALPCEEPLQYGMAVNGTTLFWRTLDANIVTSMPLDGGTPSRIFFGDQSQDWPVMIAADETAIYYTNAGGSTTGLPGNVMKLALDGGAPVTLVSNQTSPYGIAVEGDTVYWGDVAGGTAEAATVMSITPK